MPQVKLKVPKSVLELPQEHREAIIDTLRESMKLPKRMSVITASKADEHNMWSRSTDPLMAQAEDEFYQALALPWRDRIAELMSELGIQADEDKLRKSLSDEYLEYADELQKSKGGRKVPKITDLLEIQSKQRKQVLDTTTGKKPDSTSLNHEKQKGEPWTKKQLQKLDSVLRKKIPQYDKLVEKYMTRAGFIGKILAQADQEDLATEGALIETVFPETIQVARNRGVVLTLREKEKAEARGEKVEIKPLSKQEAQAVRHAENHCASKVTEADERIRARIKQLVIRAQRERWTVRKLETELYDALGDLNRDWRRIAITELAMATNDAFLTNCEDGATVVGMGAENACKYCKQYVIGHKFTVLKSPPVDDSYDTEMHYVWAGKTNYGRNVATYIPCIPMHPNCRCRWHVLSRFYTVDKRGDIVRKPTAQLIQEERLKRGLPPDPNLKW